MTVSKSNIFFCIFLVSMSAVLMLTSSDERYNAVNIVISFFSVLVVFFSIESIRINGLKAYNVFAFFFFFPLFINTLILSNLQITKEWVDIYFLFFGPVILILTLCFFEKTPIPKCVSTFRVVDVSFFYTVLLVAFICLKLYIGSVKGFKIGAIANAGADLSFNAFALPGYSGAAGILQWVILILSFNVNKRLRFIGIISLIVFNSILGVNRGDLTRTVSFILIYQIFEINYSKGMFRMIFEKYKPFLIKFVLFFLFAFITFGQLREGFQDREVAAITELLRSKIDSLIFAWLYSYFALGYDVFLLYVRAEYFGHYEYLTSFLKPSDKLSPPLSLTLWPFNQTTVLRGYVASMGYSYFIGMFAKGVITGVVLMAAKSLRIKGLYVFIIMFLVFSFFSEYFLSRSIMSAVLLVIFIYPFLKQKETKL